MASGLGDPQAGLAPPKSPRPDPTTLLYTAWIARAVLQEGVRAVACASCGIRLTERGFATFMCPACGEQPMGRCVRCRDQGVRYRCRKCGFEGP
ncbi:MAG TPA: zinc finger domain-containing protein [Candidatus Thermoplasmatota archaeon]